jgi:hypothetical protein
MGERQQVWMQVAHILKPKNKNKNLQIPSFVKK